MWKREKKNKTGFPAQVQAICTRFGVREGDRNMKAVIIIICVVIILALFSLWNYRRFMPALKSYGEPKYKVIKKVIHIKANGRTIYGEILLPEGKEGPLATVICSHGFGSSYTLCESMAGMPLASQGYAAVCCDFCGGSKKTKSDLTMMDMSIFTEKEDLLAIIDYVKQQEFVDPDNLFLLGESQGGMVSAITAVERMDDLKAMILYYPAFCIPDMAHERFEKKEDITEVCDAFGLKISRKYYEDVWDLDIYDEIARFDKPVLIMHGDKDQTVPHKYGKEGAAAYPDAEFITFPGEVHGWTGKGKIRAFQNSLKFLESQIQK